MVRFTAPPEEEVLPGSARSSAGPSSLLHCHRSCKSDPCRDLEMLLVYGARGPPMEAKGNSRPLVAGRDLKCPMPEPLIVPGLVEQTRRSEVGPRLMNRLLALWAHERPCGEVEVVVDMGKPVAGNHLRIGQGQNVDDATEARRAGEDLIRVDDQRGMFVLVDDHR